MLDEPDTKLAAQLADAGLLVDAGDFPGNGRLAVRDPATGALVAQVAISDASGARAAVDAAQAAFPGWAALLPGLGLAPAPSLGGAHLLLTASPPPRPRAPSRSPTSRSGSGSAHSPCPPRRTRCAAARSRGSRRTSATS